MGDNIAKIILYLLLLWPYSSVIVILYYVIYKNRDLSHKPIWGIKLFDIVFWGYGYFIGMSIFFEAGFEKALFFIPNSWGFFSDYWQFVQIKSALSIILAIVTAFFTWNELEKFYKK